MNRLTWHLRVEDSHMVVDASGVQWPCCSAGLFSRWLYIEIMQGVDMPTAVFYRWLRIGIPNHGCLRFCLQRIAL